MVCPFCLAVKPIHLPRRQAASTNTLSRFEPEVLTLVGTIAPFKFTPGRELAEVARRLQSIPLLWRSDVYWKATVGGSTPTS